MYKRQGRYRINKKLNLTTDMDVRVLTKEDIIEIIKYLIELINSKADVDDIDHLSNRRVRTVGEQLSNQFAVGLARMSRTIRERMNVRDNEVFTPIDLIKMCIRDSFDRIGMKGHAQCMHSLFYALFHTLLYYYRHVSVSKVLTFCI